jgi:hypothetical protein
MQTEARSTHPTRRVVGWRISEVMESRFWWHVKAKTKIGTDRPTPAQDVKAA